MDSANDKRGPAVGGSPAEAAVDPWLRRFAAHETRSVSEVEALVARIVSYRGFGFTTAEREDLVQESMAQLWESIGGDRFDPGRSFEAFVRTLATRRCIDLRRGRRATSELSPELVSSEADPEAALLARERLETGRRVLKGLGERCRELIRLHAGEGLTYAEIGRRWDRSEGALRVQMCECLSQARRRLRDITARTPEGTR
ncbi:MAG TPA: sigma-70 family RNA polymerase sigma factor [Candidatus Polarisedimenticolia bacterium]|nr:sigma-70 family RNA polymerase sigma factor [Candidatus Polarisedimenticolia bacterium]